MGSESAMKILRQADKANPQSVRRANTQLVLQAVCDGRGHVSRADLVRLTGLNTATISSVVTELLEAGYLVEAGFGPSAGGKPPVLLDINEQTFGVLGLQVSRTGFRAVEVDLRGVALREVHGRFAEWERAEVVIEAVLAALAGFQGGDRRHLALGVAVPGLVDATGMVTRSVTLGWHEVALRDALRSRLDLPVHLINDSNAAAFAEASTLDEKSPSVMALYIGDGVGAGLILSGGLFAGDGYSAGEVGHLNLRTHDLSCACGRRGCLEAAACLPMLTGQKAPAFGEPSTSEARVDRRAARRAARNILALMELNHDLLDIRQTVICGPVCSVAPELLDILRSELAESELGRAGRITVDLSALGDRGALVGAAACATHEELGLLWTAGDSEPPL